MRYPNRLIYSLLGDGSENTEQFLKAQREILEELYPTETVEENENGIIHTEWLR